MAHKELLVSVIVTTRNNQHTLAACLASIAAQTYDSVELIVVDNASIDNTVSIARQYTKLVFDKGPERSAQRNYGVSKAKGEYVLIIDSDMELPPTVIRECIESMATDTQSVIIPEISFGEGFWARCKALERSFYVGVDWIEAPRFFAKNLYRKVGGYDANMAGGEDWDLGLRIRGITDVAHTTSFIRHNEGRPTLRSIINKRRYYAAGFERYYAKKEVKIAARSPVKQALSYYWLYLSNPLRLFHNPIEAIGMLFMKSLEFSSFMIKKREGPNKMTPKIESLYLHVSQSYLPYGGGLEQTMSKVIHLLGKTNTEIICISGNDEDSEKSFDIREIYKVTRVASRFRRRDKDRTEDFNSLTGGTKKLSLASKISMLIHGLSGGLTIASAINARVRSSDGKIYLHAHTLSTLFICVIIKKIHKRRSICLIFVNHFTFTKSGFYLVDYLIKYSIINSNYSVSLSNYSRDQLIVNFDANKASAKICYNWLDTDSIMKASSHYTSTIIPLLFVGRLVPEKGVGWLIEVAKYIKYHDLPFHISVVGDSDHWIKSDLLSEAENNERLSVLGKIDKPLLYEIYDRNDVLLFPIETKGEGLPNVILEAKAYGLSIVTSNLPPIPEILSYFPNSNDIYIDYKNVANVLDSIKQIYNIPARDSKIVTSIRNRSHINKHFSSKNAHIFELIYAEYDHRDLDHAH